MTKVDWVIIDDPIKQTPEELWTRYRALRPEHIAVAQLPWHECDILDIITKDPK